MIAMVQVASSVCLVRRSAGVRPEVRFRPVRSGGMGDDVGEQAGEGVALRFQSAWISNTEPSGEG